MPLVHAFQCLLSGLFFSFALFLCRFLFFFFFVSHKFPSYRYGFHLRGAVLFLTHTDAQSSSCQTPGCHSAQVCVIRTLLKISQRLEAFYRSPMMLCWKQGSTEWLQPCHMTFSPFPLLFDILPCDLMAPSVCRCFFYIQRSHGQQHPLAPKDFLPRPHVFPVC